MLSVIFACNPHGFVWLCVQVFDFLDQDGEGSIDISELSSAFLFLGLSLSTQASLNPEPSTLVREAQAAPGALVGTGPSAARWRLHHHWSEALETSVVKLTGRLL